MKVVVERTLFPRFTLIEIVNTVSCSLPIQNSSGSFWKSVPYFTAAVMCCLRSSIPKAFQPEMTTRQQLIEAIAAVQFTPGPVFSSVTFIGYQINGISGAVISTIAIFLPSFVFVAFLNPLVKKMRSSVLFSAFLDAVNIASVAIIISVCFAMCKDSVNDWRTILIAVLSIALTFRYRKVNSAFIVLGGSILGYFLMLL